MLSLLLDDSNAPPKQMELENGMILTLNSSNYLVSFSIGLEHRRMLALHAILDILNRPYLNRSEMPLKNFQGHQGAHWKVVQRPFLWHNTRVQQEDHHVYVGKTRRYVIWSPWYDQISSSLDRFQNAHLSNYAFPISNRSTSLSTICWQHAIS